MQSLWRIKHRVVASFLAGIVALAVALIPATASATTLRLHPFQFNACDQFGRGNSACQAEPSVRASAILASLNSWSPNIVTLQEMCRSTYNIVASGLGSSWRSYFVTTYVTPSTDNRCQSSDHTWGVVVMARATTISPPIRYVLGTEASGEERVLLCLDFTVGFNMRICTTHLTSTSQAVASSQAQSAANSVNSWIAAGKAVVVGGDFNLDVRTCGNGNIQVAFRPWYYGSFGAGASLCYTGGTGSMYEVDHYTSFGDGTYDEDSSGARKFDYIFGNRQNMLGDYGGDATSSDVSDHDPIRGAITAHD